MPPKKNWRKNYAEKGREAAKRKLAKRQREGDTHALSHSRTHLTQSTQLDQLDQLTHSFTHTLISFVLHMLNCLFDLIQIKSLNHFLIFCVSSFEFNTLQF